MANPQTQQPNADQPKTTPATDVPTIDKPSAPPVPPEGWQGMEAGKDYRLPSGNLIRNS